MLAALAGLGVAAGIMLAAAAWRGLPSRPARRPRRAATRVTAGRVTAAVLAATSVAVLTRWPVAAAAAAVLVVVWPTMFGAARAAAVSLAKLEALALWTESLRDTIAAAVSLEQAIPATVDNAPAALDTPLRVLAARLRARTALPEALRGFAEDLDDPSADLVVGALLLNTRLRGPGLVRTLTALATSTREELEMRRRVEAGRRTLRRAAAIVAGVTLALAGGLAVLSRQYVAPYSTPTGQVVLALVVGIFAIGFGWLRRLSIAHQPQRFLKPADVL